MALLSWIEAVRELSAPALTVRAAEVDPTLQNRLMWDQFFPRRNVDSTELDEILTEEVEIEVVAERREWDTRGRPVIGHAPARERLEFIPIETYFEIMEKEINDLMLRFRGNQQLLIDEIMPRIPERTDRCVRANYRRIEKDAFNGWSDGTVTRRNAQTGALAQTFDFNFAASRYPTAAVAWDDVSVNAYQEFLLAVRAADKRLGGPCGGVIIRQADWDLIEAAATSAIAINLSPQILMNREQVMARLRGDLNGRNFVVFIFEDTLVEFLDGGLLNTAEVDRWPLGKIGFFPASNGGAVGFTAFAPVVRAYELSAQAPGAGIDLRGNTVYVEVSNGGRMLRVEVQLNAFPVPDERRMFVMDIGTA